MAYITEKRLKVTSWRKNIFANDLGGKVHRFTTSITVCDAGDFVYLVIWDAEGLRGTMAGTGLGGRQGIEQHVASEIRHAFRTECIAWKAAYGAAE